MSHDSLRYPSAHEDFNDVLLEQLRRTPWLLISASVHVFVVIVLVFFMKPEEDSKDEHVVAIATAPLVDDEPEVIDPPVDKEDPILDQKDIETPEDYTEDFTEDNTDFDMEETQGESEFHGETSFDRSSNSDAVGLGPGSAGGPRGKGGRRDGRKGSRRHKTEICVERGLEWLHRHQSPDGSWDSDGFCCKAGGCSCQHESRGGPTYDVGVTGLALLAFLGAGESPTVGEYKKTVAKGLRWLKKRQDGEGAFASRTTSKFAYNQAIASLAMIEAYDLTKMPLLKTSAQKGLNFCLAMQNPYKAWRYGVADGQNDVSVTGWMAMVLKAAKSAGLKFDPRAASWTREYIKEMMDEESGRIGYVRPGELTVREPDKKEEFPSEESEAMTAVGVCTRIFLSDDPRENRDIKLSLENLLSKKMPVWDEARGSVDMYYWYYGTLAMYQAGGHYWKSWESAMKDAIIKRQHQKGDLSGSWDPKGAWGEQGGRVYSTALMTMCLQVYYRYGRVFGTN